VAVKGVPRTVFRMDVVDYGPDRPPEIRYEFLPGVDIYRVKGVVVSAVIGETFGSAVYFVRTFHLADQMDPYAWRDPFDGIVVGERD
jgi:hypothetical protein